MNTHPIAGPEALNLNEEKVGKLLARVRQEVDEGLLPAVQVAVAKDGKLALFESFGDATDESLFCIFSATKAITASAIWILLQENKLGLDERVADIIPGFGSNRGRPGTGTGAGFLTMNEPGRKTKMKKTLLIAAVFAVAMILCAGPSVAGMLQIKGSTTVLPIAQVVSEAYMKANPDVKISLSE